jgi:hypothetical protein
VNPIATGRDKRVGLGRGEACRGFIGAVERPVPTLARLYERHAEECARAAEQTDDPKRREMLIKLAMQWRQEAQALRQSPQPNRSEDDGKAATRSTKSAPNTTKRSQKGNTGPRKTRALRDKPKAR